MVALAGRGWTLAPSLVIYVEEADRYFPNRDRTSDGSIGDQAHAARESDHNPADGFVHAIDLDEDVAPGLDLKRFAEALRLSHDPRIRYVIYEGRTFKSYAKGSHGPWEWMPYAGPNAHEHHLHLSIIRSSAARDDLRPWGFKALAEGGKPKPNPTQEDEGMDLIAKKANDTKWWAVSATSKRHITDRHDAAQHVFCKTARWNDGEPFVLPDEMIDRLPELKTQPAGR